MKKLVLILRRDPEELTANEKKSIEEKFPEGVEYQRVDPADFLEHDRLCRELNPVAVLLPRERPIPTLAIEHGFSHVIVDPEGVVMELQPLYPQFIKFKP